MKSMTILVGNGNGNIIRPPNTIQTNTIISLTESIALKTLPLILVFVYVGDEHLHISILDYHSACV